MNFDLKNHTIQPDEFFNEFDEPVQEFVKPEPKPEIGTDNNFDTQASGNPFSDLSSDEFAELNEDTSGFLIESAVGLIAFFIAMFVAKNDQSDKYMLPENEVQKIKALTARMIPKHKPIMPNWAALATTISMAYAPLLMQASSDRKLAEQAAEIEQLKQQLKTNE